VRFPANFYIFCQNLICFIFKVKAAISGSLNFLYYIKYCYYFKSNYREKLKAAFNVSRFSIKNYNRSDFSFEKCCSFPLNIFYKDFSERCELGVGERSEQRVSPLVTI